MTEPTPHETTVATVQCRCTEWMTYSNPYCGYCGHTNPHYIPARVKWGERGYAKKTDMRQFAGVDSEHIMIKKTEHANI